jgi:hypothetical protein
MMTTARCLISKDHALIIDVESVYGNRPETAPTHKAGPMLKMYIFDVDWCS